MARGLTIGAVGISEDTLLRVRRVLGAMAEVEPRALGDAGDPPLADKVLLLSGDGAWRETLTSFTRRHPDVPVILVTDQPESAHVLAALEARRLAGAVSSSLPAGALTSAVLAAKELCDLRHELTHERQQARQRTENLATLAEISRRTAELGSVQDILSVVTHEARRLVHFDLLAAGVAMDGAPPHVHLHCVRACSPHDMEATRDACTESLRDLAKERLDSQPLVVTTGGVMLPEGTDQQQQGILGAASDIPVSADGNRIGLFRITSPADSELSADDRRTLHLLASQTGEALVRLRERQSGERRRLTMMVDSMADGLILTDRQTDQVMVNPAARRLLGIDASQSVTQQFLKEALGFYPFDLVSTGPDAAGPIREEVRVKDKVLSSMISPVRDRNGVLEGVVVVLRDFTEAKANSQKQSEFVAMVSHELRSPLTSVTGGLDIVLGDYAGHLSDKARRYLELARDSCSRLNQIVDDLLDVARAKRGPIEIQLTPIRLEDLSQEVVNRFGASAAAKQVDLQLQTDGNPVRIVGDRDRLARS